MFNRRLSDRSNAPRRGIVTFWALVTIPIFLIMLGVVLEIGNLWMARTQLQNALEAAALAAVKTWGDANGGDTTTPRQVGNEFASACLINGASVSLSAIDGTLNQSGGGNANTTCNGVLVFGVLTDDDPLFVKNTCESGGCGTNASVLIDASSQGNLNAMNDWGVSYQPTADSDPGDFITRVVIRLPGAQGNTTLPYFDFPNAGALPNVSTSHIDNAASNRVACDTVDLNCGGGSAGRSQADVSGIDPADIHFKIMDVADFGDDGMGGRLECSAPATPVAAGQTSKILVIDFCDSGCTNATTGELNPGDRFRFGANVNPGSVSPFDADNLGAIFLGGELHRAEVTVCFNTGDVVTGFFVDTNHVLTGQQPSCANVGFAPMWGQCNPSVTPLDASGRRGMILNASGTTNFRPDQPPPPSNSATNNGQSLVLFNVEGGAGLGFAVRAQAEVEVPSLVLNLFGFSLAAPYKVQARADALYDCELRTPRLYHITDPNFGCTAPCP